MLGDGQKDDFLADTMRVIVKHVSTFEMKYWVRFVDIRFKYIAKDKMSSDLKDVHNLRSVYFGCEALYIEGWADLSS